MDDLEKITGDCKFMERIKNNSNTYKYNCTSEKQCEYKKYELSPCGIGSSAYCTMEKK